MYSSLYPFFISSLRISLFNCTSLFQRMSMQSNISGDTIAVHLSDLGNKQVYTKTGYYKVGLTC